MKEHIILATTRAPEHPEPYVYLAIDNYEFGCGMPFVIPSGKELVVRTRGQHTYVLFRDAPDPVV